MTARSLDLNPVNHANFRCLGTTKENPITFIVLAFWQKSQTNISKPENIKPKLFNFGESDLGFFLVLCTNRKNSG